MSTTAAGRPRDPDVDRRLVRAAVAHYAELGWAGFSLDAVARRACVGKAALYRRWTGKEELLVAALTAGVPAVVDADTGSLRGDLVRLAEQLLTMHLGVEGQALRRMDVEYPAIPDIQEPWEQRRRAQIVAARAIVRRGIDRGEIAPDTSATLLLDTLCGGVVTHVIATPAARRAEIDVPGYAERVVTFLLRAVT
jgi:AcrR family transcriptional regulator